jgi:hypothetical protein
VHIYIHTAQIIYIFLRVSEWDQQNQIIGPEDEDLPSPDGKQARFYPGTDETGIVYQQGTDFTAVLQIDPVVL